MPDPPLRPRIAMVWTRQLDGQSMAGRLRVAHAIRRALGESAELVPLHLPNMLTDWSLSRFAQVVLAWVGSLFSGPLLPIQCAMFASFTDHRRLVASIPQNVDTAYLDSVRTYALLVYLRKMRPDLRIVVDLDDLMSRRMALLLRSRQPLSPGYLTRHLPNPLKRLVMSRVLGNLIVLYEGATLRGVERRMAGLADSLILLSSEDGSKLRALCGGGADCAKIDIIPPGVEAQTTSRPLTAPVRFVFIGSDALTQNRLTIDYLIALWRRCGLQAPLVLFGLQSRALTLPPGVYTAGYVDQITDVYDGRSILLAPSLIGGGVKTKVLEAFAHGAAVIGNPLTFESMPIIDYPLNLVDERALLPLLSDPESHLPLFDRAAAIGAKYIAAFHSVSAFAARWRRIAAPSEDRTAISALREAVG